MKTATLVLAALAAETVLCTKETTDKPPSEDRYKWKSVIGPSPWVGNTGIGISDKAAPWGVGVAPWDLVQPIKEACRTSECATNLTVPTKVMKEGLPVEGNVTLNVQGWFGESMEPGSTESLVDAMAAALLGFYDPLISEFLPFANRDDDGNITVMRYEPVYVAPAVVIVRIDGVIDDRKKDFFLQVKVDGAARHFLPERKMCAQAGDRAVEIYRTFKNLFEMRIEVSSISCLKPKKARG